jgi:hypothetical protein
MALRAVEPFIVWNKDGKNAFEANQLVPAKIAKGRESLVYDDTKAVTPEAPYTRGPAAE